MGGVPGPDGHGSTLDGRYELAQVLSESDVTVRRAWDSRLDREVTVVLHPGRVREDTGPWRREIDALGMLDHPHIASLYDGGILADAAYAVLQVTGARTLNARIAACRPTRAQLERWGDELADALDTMHLHGVAGVTVGSEAILVDAQDGVRWYRFADATLDSAGGDARRADHAALAGLLNDIRTASDRAVTRRARISSIAVVVVAIVVLAVAVLVGIAAARPGQPAGPDRLAAPRPAPRLAAGPASSAPVAPGPAPATPAPAPSAPDLVAPARVAPPSPDAEHARSDDPPVPGPARGHPTGSEDDVDEHPTDRHDDAGHQQAADPNDPNQRRHDGTRPGKVAVARRLSGRETDPRSTERDAGWWESRAGSS